MTPDKFAELCRLKREAWAFKMREGGELPKPPEPEPLPQGTQGELW